MIAKLSKLRVCIFLVLLAEKGYAEGNLPVPYPILLIPGYGSDIDQSFRAKNLISSLSPLYSVYPDDVFGLDSALGSYPRNTGEKVFGMDYTDGCSAPDLSVDRLTKFINGDGQHKGLRRAVQERFPNIFKSKNDVKVIIIAFSVGGLVAREYIKQNPTNHGIAKLITIATPHSGTDIVGISEAADKIVLVSSAFIIAGGALAALGTLTLQPELAIAGGEMVAAGAIGQSFGVSLDTLVTFILGDCAPTSETTADAMRKLKGDSDFMKNLNQSVPTDLEYRQLAGFFKIDQILRAFFGALNFSQIRSIFDGDLIVPRVSALGLNVDMLKDSPNTTVDCTPNDLICHSNLTKNEHEIIKRFLADSPQLLSPALISSISGFSIQAIASQGRQQFGGPAFKKLDGSFLQPNSFLDIQNPNVVIEGKIFDWLIQVTEAQISSLGKSEKITLLPAEVSFASFTHTYHIPLTGKQTVILSATAVGQTSKIEQPLYIVGISQPERGGNISGINFDPNRKVAESDILGNADAFDFRSYRIKHGIGQNPISFTPIIESAVTKPGNFQQILGSWDARRLNGIQTLRCLINGTEVNKTTFTIGQREKFDAIS